MLPLPVFVCALAVLAAPPDPELPVFKVVVRPAAIPSPALRYKLLPEMRDLQSGNALVLYYKAFSPDMQTYRRQDIQESLEAALEKPLDELRKNPGSASIARSNKMLDLVDEAARRTYIDWELLPALRRDGTGLLLPDAQGMRSFALMLAVRVRLDVADGKFDRAVYGLQTGFALARHLCETPTLIHSVIAAAVANIMLQQLDTLIQQPGAPNLYWALTDLPLPFIDLRKPLEGERMWIDWLAPGVRERVNDPTAAPMPADQLQTIADRFMSVEGGRKPDTVSGRLLVSVFLSRQYPAAREWLATRGWTAAQIDALPVTQAALMYEVNEYDRLFDAAFKWRTLPPPVAFAGMDAATRQLNQESATTNGPLLAKLLLPSTRSVYEYSRRIDRRIAALRCVEAVRLHAASHGGRLPASLADINEVPVPDDPATGRPFTYTVSGNTATLTAPPYSRPASSRNTFTYELSLPE